MRARHAVRVGAALLPPDRVGRRRRAIPTRPPSSARSSAGPRARSTSTACRTASARRWPAPTARAPATSRACRRRSRGTSSTTASLDPRDFTDPYAARPPARGRRSLGGRCARRRGSIWRPRSTAPRRPQREVGDAAPDACPPESGNSTPSTHGGFRSMRPKMLARSLVLLCRPRCSPPAPSAPTTTIRPRGNSRSSRRPRGSPAAVRCTAKIETTLGTFTCELYDKQAPITVANFVGSGARRAPLEGPEERQVGEKKPFYDGLIFHRVIPGFMIQGGDPLGTGTGNPGYRFEDEFSPELSSTSRPCSRWRTPGRARTARSSSSPKGRPQHLTGRHTIFGLCEPAVAGHQDHRREARSARQTGDRRGHQEGDDLPRRRGKAKEAKDRRRREREPLRSCACRQLDTRQGRGRPK